MRLSSVNGDMGKFRIAQHHADSIIINSSASAPPNGTKIAVKKVSDVKAGIIIFDV